MFRKSVLITVVSLLVLSVALLVFLMWRPQPMITHFDPGQASTDGSKAAKLLVFTKTGAFRHASIKDGIAAMRKLAAEHHIAMDFTEDSSVFTNADLEQYRAVIFLLTSGNILDDTQKAAFQHYIESGGGFVGVHSASDTEHLWPWYGKLVGTYFESHPHVTQATVDVVDHKHSSTVMLPDHWVRTDEWYNFVTRPGDSIHILMTVDERTYKGGTMGADHPIAWYQQYDGGRSWYTAMGHTSESYYEPLFLDHLWGGIVYAAKLT